jgi:hypothetical protein
MRGNGDGGRDEVDFIDLIDRPAGSTLSTSSNPQVNLVNPVNLVQKPAGRVNLVQKTPPVMDYNSS